jgi:hypothetical protein
LDSEASVATVSLEAAIKLIPRYSSIDTKFVDLIMVTLEHLRLVYACLFRFEGMTYRNLLEIAVSSIELSKFLTDGVEVPTSCY